MTVECPYCQHDNEPDCECLGQDDECELECEECGQIFIYTVDYLPVYSPRKAPCLNGEPHNFKKTDTSPARFARLRCESFDLFKYCPRCGEKINVEKLEKVN